MTHSITALGRTTRRIALLTIPLLVAATATAGAHSDGGYGGGMMGGGGWGLFGGTGLWQFLWVALALAVPLYIAYSFLGRATGESDVRTATKTARTVRTNGIEAVPFLASSDSCGGNKPATPSGGWNPVE